MGDRTRACVDARSETFKQIETYYNGIGHHPFYPRPLGPLPGAHHFGHPWDGASIVDQLVPLLRSGRLGDVWLFGADDQPWQATTGLKVVPLVGLIALGAVTLVRRRTPGAAWVIGAFAVLAWTYLALPYWNEPLLFTQTRFAMPALFTGAAIGFAGLSRLGVAPLWLAGLVAVGLALDMPRLDLSLPALAWDSATGGFRMADATLDDRLRAGRWLVTALMGAAGLAAIALARAPAGRRAPTLRWAGAALACTLALALAAAPAIREPLRPAQTKTLGGTAPQRHMVDAATWLDAHATGRPAAVATSFMHHFLYLFSGRALDRRLGEGARGGRDVEVWRADLTREGYELLVVTRTRGTAEAREAEAAREAGWPELFGDDWVSVFEIPAAPGLR